MNSPDVSIQVRFLSKGNRAMGTRVRPLPCVGPNVQHQPVSPADPPAAKGAAVRHVGVILLVKLMERESCAGEWNPRCPPTEAGQESLQQRTSASEEMQRALVAGDGAHYCTVPCFILSLQWPAKDIRHLSTSS